ncbi:hypothetical protein B566_EDAN014180 [Ephemera danica]|nr:hypothetical protein B566_EDAN014180 [Ephemera danica]
MVFCCIKGCTSRSAKPEHKGVVFFLLPTINRKGSKEIYERTKRRRELWLARIDRGDGFPSEKDKDYGVYVCCKHFMGDPSKITDENHIDWAPSRHLSFDSPTETPTASKQQEEKPSTVTKEVKPGKRKKKELKEPKKKRLNLSKVPTQTSEPTEPSSPSYKIVIVKNSAITVPPSGDNDSNEAPVTIPLQPQVIETIYLPDYSVKSEENSRFLPETDENLGLGMWDENNDERNLNESSGCFDHNNLIVRHNLDEYPNDDKSLVLKQNLEETSSNDSNDLVLEQQTTVNDDCLLTDEEKALRDFDTNITKRPVETKCKKSTDGVQSVIKTIGYPTNTIANTNKLFDINGNTCLHCLKDHQNQYVTDTV